MWFPSHPIRFRARHRARHFLLKERSHWGKRDLGASSRLITFTNPVSLIAPCPPPLAVCPTLHSTVPPFPNSHNPNCPAPNNDDLGNIPALAIRNSYQKFFFTHTFCNIYITGKKKFNIFTFIYTCYLYDEKSNYCTIINFHIFSNKN